jgi:Cft2 family RNA processing exonuclease
MRGGSRYAASRRHVALAPFRPMDLHFLGGATTVTGSRFLLATSRARVLIDCGMFQGSPNEVIRNRVPLGFDAGELDAVVLTHAHLDHCGLLPILVREGFNGPIYATKGTVELATLVLLDSGRLHEEFAKRGARRARRNPGRAAAVDHATEVSLREAAEEAAATEAGEAAPAEATAAEWARAWSDEDAEERGAHAVERGERLEDPEEALRAQPPVLEIDLDAPLYTEDDAKAVLPRFAPIDYHAETEVAPGIRATLLDAGHILGSAIVRLRVEEADGAPERIVVFSGDLGRPNTPIIRDPETVDAADYVVVESTYGGREHEPQADGPC